MGLIQIIVTLIIFFIVKYFAFRLTEEWGLPEWLNYKPWVCNKCLGFWSLTAIYLSIGIVLNLWIFLAFGMILTILDTIAIIIDERNKTIKIEDYDNIK